MAKYKRIGPGLLKSGKVYYSDVGVPKGRDAKGKVIYKRLRRALSADKNIALQRIGQMMGEKSAKKYHHAPKDISWESFKERYLNDRRGKSGSTHRITSRTIEELENFLVPFTRLSQITVESVSNLFTDMKVRKPPIGLYMRNRILTGIKHIMHRAEDWGYIQRQKWSAVKEEKEPQGRLVWFTMEEIKQILTVCRGTWETIALLGARAGLRRAEMYWLEWQDVDFERNRIHVNAKEGWHPKDYERRMIPMKKDLRSHLESIQTHQGFVLGPKRPDLDSITAYFTRLVSKAGLEGGPHTLRHSFGAHLASAGVSMRVIQKLMGHSSVETTEIYAHLSPSSLDEAIEKLPE